MAGKRGRPSRYSKAVAKAICERLAEGESLRSICRDENMPAHSTVVKWALEDRNGFYDQYAKAREIGLDVMADELLDIADDGSNDWMERFGKDGESLGWMINGEAVSRSRLRVDTRKWYLSKLAPKRFGDRVALEHTGKDGGPIEVADARERLASRIAGIASRNGTAADHIGANGRGSNGATA